MNNLPAEYIILGEWVWIAQGTLLKDVAIAIGSGIILEVGPRDDLLSKFPSAKRLGGDGRFVIPGMVSTHTHLFQTFLKGVGQGLPLNSWIKKVTAPAAIAMNEREAYLSACVGILEAIHSGTTSIFEYSYGFPNREIFNAITQAFLDTGVNGWIGIGINDAGEDFGLNPAFIKPLEKIPALLDGITSSIERQSTGRIKSALAPSSIRGLSRTGISVISDYANSNNLIFSMHINETADYEGLAMEKFGMPLLPALYDLNILNERFLAVHCVKITPEDISSLARSNAGVSHNPVSNMYLGAGVAPITKMVNAGIPISLGVDGAASNNSQDMLETMKFAVLGQRAFLQDPSVMQAEDALELATGGGARTLQVGDHVGAIKPGFTADLTILNLNTPKSIPVYDPVETIVFNCGEENVETVICGGKVLLHGGKILIIDEENILQEASHASRQLLQRINS